MRVHMVISSYVACGSFFHHIRCFIVRSSTRPNLHNQPGVRLRPPPPPPPHTHTQSPDHHPPLPQPSLTIGQWVALCRQCTHIHAHTHMYYSLYTHNKRASPTSHTIVISVCMYLFAYGGRPVQASLWLCINSSAGTHGWPRRLTRGTRGRATAPHGIHQSAPRYEGRYPPTTSAARCLPSRG